MTKHDEALALLKQVREACQYAYTICRARDREEEVGRNSFAAVTKLCGKAIGAIDSHLSRHPQVAQAGQEPVARIHSDGYWTAKPGFDPLGAFGIRKAYLDVYAHPQPTEQPANPAFNCRGCQNMSGDRIHTCGNREPDGEVGRAMLRAAQDQRADWRAKELAYVVEACLQIATAADKSAAQDLARELRAWASNRLNAAPVASAQVRFADPPKFPTMLRKMWSGGEIQRWINDHWLGTRPVASAPPEQPAREAVPDAVLRAAERLATPLDPSRVKPGMQTTNQADIDCAQLILAYLRALAARAILTAAQPDAANQPEGMVPAARDVLAERERQKSVEGWTPEHDDQHIGGSLSFAAACYALCFGEHGPYPAGEPPGLWPSSWHPAWWKPRDRRRNLVRAGALLLAEIERLDRAAAQRGDAE